MNVPVSNNYRDKGDGVSYESRDAQGKPHVYRTANCYSGIMGNLGGYEILCRPRGAKNTAPSLMFQRFFRELIRHGIVPKEVVPALRQGENVLVVPRKGWDKQTVFVTLSMYRHADCHGKSIVGKTMYLYDRLRKDGVNFLQCLHWAFCNTTYSSWHSCIDLSFNPTPYGRFKNRNTHKNLKWGLSLAVYAKMPLEERKAFEGEWSTMMFDALAGKLKDIELENVDEILDPKYAKYYEDPQKARKE